MPAINTTKQYILPSFQITQDEIEEFQQNGFTVFPKVFDAQSVSELNHRLELILRGVYDTGRKPDKTPKLIKVPLPGDSEVLRFEEDRRQNWDKSEERKVEEQKEILLSINNVSGSVKSKTIRSKEKQDDEKCSCSDVKNARIKDETSNSSIQREGNQMTKFAATATATATATAKPNTKKKKKAKKSKLGALGYSGNQQNVKVMQIINVHKCDTFFRQLVTTEVLGYMVSKLMQWPNGARLAQDQIWAKPPGSPPLAYHRDSPYFMFTPHSVATVWIALDDMYDEEIGPLEYVKGSHLWNDGRVGSSQNFFQANGGKALLYSAAERSGIENYKDALTYVSMKGLQAGGLSVHDGRTWHGSGGNKSDRPRRGIGLHFVPLHVKWTETAMNSRLWRRYVEDVVKDNGDVGEIELNESDFPIVYRE